MMASASKDEPGRKPSGPTFLGLKPHLRHETEDVTMSEA